MNITSKTRALRTAALAALTLGGAALVSAAPATAGDINFTVSFGQPGYGHDRPVRRFHHDDGHYRPVSRFHHEDGFHAPVRKHVVVRQFIHDDDDGEECRVIVKKRYNRFGELVVKRVQICD